MKKRLLKKLFVSTMLCVLAFTLSSCMLLGIFLGVNFFDYDLVSTPAEYIDRYHEEGKAGYNISLVDQSYQENEEPLNSVGNQKVLVIPVYFEDYRPADLFDDPNKALQDIYKAFFGTTEQTGWESVKSYYYKSSYGKFVLEGEVLPWFAIDGTLREVARDNDYDNPSIGVLRDAIEWAKQNYPGIATKYDQDFDGYIDAVALVYANDYYDDTGEQDYDDRYRRRDINKISDLLWAFSYLDIEAVSSVNSPVANNYMWLSYDFLWDSENYYANGHPAIDCHTYIHEFGHLLGLDDYYSYDDDGTSPCGGPDMMDLNIGDHNSYSKYLLNWIEPVLIEKPGEYTLRNLQSGGENTALLIPADISTFNYSPFSEYLLIELYSPTGLNYKDSASHYMGQNDYPTMFTNVAVRIYHVDSRLVMIDAVEQTYYYTAINNNVHSSDRYFQMLGASNTKSMSFNSDYCLIEMISSRYGKNIFKNDVFAQNDDLFYKGSKLESFSFNCGTNLQYKIEVKSISQSGDSCVISIV